MSFQTDSYIRSIEALRPYLQDADHIDIKHVTGPSTVSLRAFIAGTFTYQPHWVTALLAIRWGFVRLLGMTQDGIPRQQKADPSSVPVTPGETFEFLTVKATDTERYWVGGADDKHLSIDAIAAIEPLGCNRQRFYLMTIVRHNHWTGPIYFNVIKPFHHLIVQLAVKTAIRQAEEHAIPLP